MSTLQQRVCDSMTGRAAKDLGRKAVWYCQRQHAMRQTEQPGGSDMNAASRPDDWRAGGFVCCRCRDTGRRWEQVHIAGEVGKVNEIVEFRVTECPDCNEFAVRGTPRVSFARN